MGRILDLCGEIAAVAEEGTDGLVLSPEEWDRFRGEWADDDIEDALGFVRDTLLQGELVAAADSLSARVIEVLGAFGTSAAFDEAAAGRGVLSLENMAHLARRVDRLEEVLEAFRDWDAPDRRGFDSFRRRLADHGIEREMEWDEADDERSGSADEGGDSDDE
jgi:hypothetical protein